AAKDAHLPRAEGRRRLEEGRVQTSEARAGEEIKVDEHRVGVNEQNGSGPREPPRRLGRAGQRLNGARQDAPFSVEAEKREDADERRQDHGQSDESSQHTPAGKLGALEEKRERNTDRRRERGRGERDPQTSPEGAPLVGSARELGKVGKSPFRSSQRLRES